MLAVAWSVFVWRRDLGWWTWVIGIAAIAHLSVVASVTLFPLPVQPEVIAEGRRFQTASNNLVPFRSLANALATGGYRSVIDQSVGNFLMLVPLGIYGPLLWRRMRSWKSALAVGLSASFGIELLQLAISGVLGYTYKIADIDDVILNTAGVMTGYLVVRMLGRRT
ncbi:MAG TPA: VanZ family protein [Candidatus Limnocylindrales bacterium]|nr:VanZ family protein [Candidatus Limnocylindrales bacterium]